MKKLFLLTTLATLIATTSYAQCDMYSNGITPTPATIAVGQTAIFNFEVANDAGGGPCVEPTNSVRVIFSLPAPTVYAFESIVSPAGGIGTYFDFIYNPVNRTIVGINKVPVGDLNTETVQIRVTGVAVGSVQSALNIQANPVGSGYTDVNIANNSFAAALTVTTVLPLKLQSFTGQSKLCINTLNWKSSEEKNVKSIDIESSVDGANFVKVGSVSPKNIAGDNNYSYTDEANTAKVFYRLKITDIDGHTIYSSIITLNTACKEPSASMYPNPMNALTDGNVVLKNFTGKITGQLQDMNGKQLATIKLLNGSNTINLGKYAQGTYLLKVTDENQQTQTLKIITYR